MIGRRALIGGLMAGMAAAARPVSAEAPSVVPRPKRRPEPGDLASRLDAWIGGGEHGWLCPSVIG